MIYEDLKNYFKNTPKEQIEKDWEATAKYDDIEDSVECSSYYNRRNIEVTDFIQDQQLNFNLGNVIKYVSRAGFKNPDKKIEDLKKAKYYLEYELKQLENGK